MGDWIATPEPRTAGTGHARHLVDDPHRVRRRRSTASLLARAARHGQAADGRHRGASTSCIRAQCSIAPRLPDGRLDARAVPLSGRARLSSFPQARSTRQSAARDRQTRTAGRRATRRRRLDAARADHPSSAWLLDGVHRTPRGERASDASRRLDEDSSSTSSRWAATSFSATDAAAAHRRQDRGGALPWLPLASNELGGVSSAPRRPVRVQGVGFRDGAGGVHHAASPAGCRNRNGPSTFVQGAGRGRNRRRRRRIGMAFTRRPRSMSRRRAGGNWVGNAGAGIPWRADRRRLDRVMSFRMPRICAAAIRQGDERQRDDDQPSPSRTRTRDQRERDRRGEMGRAATSPNACQQRCELAANDRSKPAAAAMAANSERHQQRRV